MGRTGNSSILAVLCMYIYSLPLKFSAPPCFTMSKSKQLKFLVLVFSHLCSLCHAEVGTAATYNPPYTPTECFGTDPSEFPSNNLFAAAGDGIWDNGASCGRQYLVRCISAAKPNTCILDQTIQVRIVDYAPNSTSRPTVSGTTMVLSATALETIAVSSPASINIEFQQV